MSDLDRAFVYFEQFKDKDVEDTLRNAKQELARLRADLAAAVTLIQDWTPDGFIQFDFGDECIACQRSSKDGHAEDCKYTALFARLEAK